jgi:hypothetical protein
MIPMSNALCSVSSVVSVTKEDLINYDYLTQRPPPRILRLRGIRTSLYITRRRKEKLGKTSEIIFAPLRRELINQSFL